MTPPNKSVRKSQYSEETELASALLQIRSVIGSEGRKGSGNPSVKASRTPPQNDAVGATTTPASPALNLNLTRSGLLSSTQPIAALAQRMQAGIGPYTASGRSGGQLTAALASSHMSPLQLQTIPNSLSFLTSLEYMENSARRGIQGAAPIQQELGISGRAGPDTLETGTRSERQVRQDQIDAALRSKPQRGRKREDLNELERLELTRTRNREHAKSTRIRKKARYEELLEEERQLHIFQKRQALEKERRNVVLRYVRARQRMILSHRRSGSTSSGDAAPADNTASMPPLQELIQDMSQFVFAVGSQDVDEGATPFDRMISYDESLLTRVEGRYGAAALTFIQYAVRWGHEGVSLNNLNGGVAEVDITLASDSKIPLQNGFLRFEFAGQDSPKLSSVCWWPTRDFLDQPMERLDAQVSHPSVVSLDPAVYAAVDGAANGKCGNEEGQNGPGMNI